MTTTYTTDDNGETCMLTITNSHAENSGMYTLQAENDSGEDALDVLITVQGWVTLSVNNYFYKPQVLVHKLIFESQIV